MEVDDMQYAIELYYDMETEEKLYVLSKKGSCCEVKQKVYGMENQTASYISLF